MKYVDEYRGRDASLALAAAIKRVVTRPWRIMEVCGGQTHSIARFGLEELLPSEVKLLHGPGCPVCVTPVETLDHAVTLAEREGVTLCTYGDMMRVPGSRRDLRAVKARGGDVRVVYSALDALEVARKEPSRQVVFLAVGFETTAPGHAMAVAQAKREALSNFSLLVSHVRVPPAVDAMLSEPDRALDGLLAAGHVCAIMGTSEYETLVAKHRIPIVVTGFEPVDILDGVLRCVTQLEAGRVEVENPYARAVRSEGNRAAQAVMQSVFTVVDRRWRGIAEIPESGLGLSEAYRDFDAVIRFALDVTPREDDPSAECLSGKVLLGRLSPEACPAFGTRCTPDHPLGATMVSSEGACAAYFRYRRQP